MTENFPPWKVNFDIKTVMNDQEKVAEYKLVWSMMVIEQKISFAGQHQLAINIRLHYLVVIKVSF